MTGTLLNTREKEYWLNKFINPSSCLKIYLRSSPDTFFLLFSKYTNLCLLYSKFAFYQEFTTFSQTNKTLDVNLHCALEQQFCPCVAITSTGIMAASQYTPLTHTGTTARFTSCCSTEHRAFSHRGLTQCPGNRAGFPPSSDRKSEMRENHSFNDWTW